MITWFFLPGDLVHSSGYMHHGNLSTYHQELHEEQSSEYVQYHLHFPESAWSGIQDSLIQEQIGFS